MSLMQDIAPTFDKCTIVIDEGLPAGLAMNAAAVLALSLGNTFGTTILGEDVKDMDGQVHRGITAVPLPILKAGETGLREIAERAGDDPEVFLVGFTAAAQAARDYASYIETMARTGSTEHTYVGLAVAGAKKAVNRLTGKLPLYR